MFFDFYVIKSLQQIKDVSGVTSYSTYSILYMYLYMYVYVYIYIYANGIIYIMKKCVLDNQM